MFGWGTILCRWVCFCFLHMVNKKPELIWLLSPWSMTLKSLILDFKTHLQRHMVITRETKTICTLNLWLAPYECFMKLLKEWSLMIRMAKLDKQLFVCGAIKQHRDPPRRGEAANFYSGTPWQSSSLSTQTYCSLKYNNNKIAAIIWYRSVNLI